MDTLALVDDFAGKRVTVMGLGRFGGGLGVARWLVGRGADVLVTDLEPEERLRESVTALRPLVDSGRVTLRLGGHNVSDFTTCDAVVANPAVPKPWENRFLRAAQAAGVPITTEIELAVRRLDRRRVIGVTGSAGKSTTAALIAHILKECGQPVLFGGNIGGSLLDRTDSLDPRTWLVLELSSFMLHWLQGWSPRVAVVTNIAANHLDWHGTFEHYVASKRAILDAQEAGDAAVLGSSVRDWMTRAGVERVQAFDDAEFGPLRIPGSHNRVNAYMAAGAAGALVIPGLTRGAIKTAAGTFPGLPHRLQLVAEHNGVRFYNDSKATTPEATAMALRAFGQGVCEPHARACSRIHLIAGGYDKGADLSPLWSGGDSIEGLYVIGATGESIASGAERELPALGRGLNKGGIQRCGTLDVAVARAVDAASPGEVVLLSPACASWDQFENYEKRGEEFVRLVRETIAATAVGKGS